MSLMVGLCRPRSALKVRYAAHSRRSPWSDRRQCLVRPGRQRREALVGQQRSVANGSFRAVEVRGLKQASAWNTSPLTGSTSRAITRFASCRNWTKAVSSVESSNFLLTAPWVSPARRMKTLELLLGLSPCLPCQKSAMIRSSRATRSAKLNSRACGSSTHRQGSRHQPHPARSRLSLMAAITQDS